MHRLFQVADEASKCRAYMTAEASWSRSGKMDTSGESHNMHKTRILAQCRIFMEQLPWFVGTEPLMPPSAAPSAVTHSDDAKRGTDRDRLAAFASPSLSFGPHSFGHWFLPTCRSIVWLPVRNSSSVVKNIERKVLKIHLNPPTRYFSLEKHQKRSSVSPFERMQEGDRETTSFELYQAVFFLLQKGE